MVQRRDVLQENLPSYCENFLIGLTNLLDNTAMTLPTGHPLYENKHAHVSTDSLEAPELSAVVSRTCRMSGNDLPMPLHASHQHGGSKKGAQKRAQHVSKACDALHG